MASTCTAAIVTVRDVSSMTKRGRKDIATWLRRQADLVESEESKSLASRYSARFSFVPKKAA